MIVWVGGCPAISLEWTTARYGFKMESRPTFTLKCKKYTCQSSQRILCALLSGFFHFRIENNFHGLRFGVNIIINITNLLFTEF